MHNIPKNSDKYFRNVDCKYFPCHDNVDPETFNCLFCFCPLNSIINCGGQYTITENGVKNCSKCGYPHRAENYDAVLQKVIKLLETIKFPEDGNRI